jgi:DUF2934 family protein
MEITREMIEKKAYELYLARGRVDGADVNDWLEAERQLRADVPRDPKPTRAPASSTKRVSANKTTRRR